MQKGTVLIIEDDKAFATLICDLLNEEGCITIAVHTLGDARKYLNISYPDIIVLDIMLPDGDGFEFFVNEIKDRENRPPVIFLTAKGEEADVMEGLNAGGIDYIRKPCNIMEARQRIMNHLSLIRKPPKRKVPIIHGNELTKREFAVAWLTAEGLSNKDIAKEVYLSESRVKTTLSEIYQKFNITGDIDKREKLADILGRDG